MDNKRVFTIQINGITESLSAVESLNKQLNELEQRIKNLEKSTVNVSTSGGGSSSASKAKTNEISAQKEINKLKEEGAKLDAKIEAAQSEVYKRVQATKDLYKETLQDQKAMAAQERLTANAYSNTMAGMKQQLADLKSVINTTDLGDSDAIKKMTQEANELTTKLKEMEEAYGQFGRNVGNYKSAAEGFSKFKIEVGGVEREFSSAREAAKTLKNELMSLPKGTEGAKELRAALQQINSELRDLEKSSQVMDDLLDAMESFAAMGQITNGFSALFGFDNDEIQRSIQKLVALQNVMQGIEKINKQLNTQEGIGKFISKGNDQIDATNFKLKRMIVSMQGTGTAAKVAATGVNLLTTAAKALSSIGLFAIISAAAWAIDKVVGAISDWVKGDADLIDSTAAVTATIKKQNEELDENLKLIKERENAKQISYAEARIEEEKAYAKALKKSRDEFLKNEQTYKDNGIVQKGKTDLYLSNAYGDKGVTSFGGFDEEIKGIDDFIERFDYLMTRVQNGQDITNSWKDTVEDAKDELVHMSKVAGGDFYNAMVKLADGTEKGTKSLVEYIKHMDELTKGRYSQAIKLGIDQGYLDGQFKLAWERYEKLKTDVYKSPLQVQLELDAKISTTLDGLDPTRAIKRDIENWENLLKSGIDSAGNVLTLEQRGNISKIIEAQKKGLDKRNSSLKNEMKKTQKTVQDAEKELARLRIDQMKEGLNKTLKQLEEERRQKIAKIKSDGVSVAELTLETNRYYDKKIEEEKKKHAENVEKIYKDMWKNIQDQAISNAQRELELIENQIEQESRANEKGSGRYVNDKGIGSYGIQGKEQLSRSTQKALGIASTSNSQFMTDMKDYIDLLREASAAEDTYKANQLRVDEVIASGAKLSDEELGKLNMQLDKSMNKWMELGAQLSATEEGLKEFYGKDLFDEAKEKLLSESYSSSLSGQIEQRLAFTELYWTTRFKIEGDAAQKVYDQQRKIEEENFKKESGETFDNYQKLLKQAEDYAKAKVDAINAAEESGEITPEKANEERLKVEQEYWKSYFTIHKNGTEAIAQLEKLLNDKLIKLDQERIDKGLKLNAEYYQDITQEMRDAQTAIAELESKQPVMNAWGFTNWNKTDANNQNLLDAYTKQAKKLSDIRKQLQKDYSQGFIDKDVYDSIMRGFDALAAGIGEKMDKVKQEMSLGNKISETIQEAQQYINEIANVFSTVLNAVWDAQDAAYNKMMDELDKSIDAVKDRYDKMDELAEEHKNNIEDIESQIAQAQGDAREHLLERYQAEIQAQRDAIRERRKAEKEQEKLEQNKERAEKKQREKERDRDAVTAAINAALAVTYAAANKWPIPAIPLMAAAAAAGAAQVAAIKSQKFGDGGVIEGKSHAAGGVKVLGGHAEVEGGEYITNKVTTAKNVELLEYINTKKRRVNLDDLIEFYGNPVRKNIQAVRTRFADGGELPTLSNNISIGNGLATAMQEYANRPTVVSVVDIIDKTQKVNNVKVMAGLNV